MKRKQNKIRLDLFLVLENLIETRTKAQAHIMAGDVLVNGQLIIKPSHLVKSTDKIELKKKNEFVSRGALKLAKVFDEFSLNTNDKIALDAGASTGGFTDYLLKKGASKVYAVDVGYGQLAQKLRDDNRVINLEKVNVRYLTKDKIPEKVDIITLDLSFISLTKVLENVTKFLKEKGDLVTLIKPQFEAQRKQVKSGGVVKDINVHKEVLRNIILEAVKLGFILQGLTFSPIKGPKGNIEYLALFNRNQSSYNINEVIDDITQQAFKELTGDLK